MMQHKEVENKSFLALLNCLLGKCDISTCEGCYLMNTYAKQLFITDAGRQYKILKGRLIQEEITDAWLHMVVIILLNNSNIKQVRPVFYQFKDRFPTPKSLLNCSVDVISKIIKKTGMQNTKTLRIIGMTWDFLEWDGINAAQLYGIGEYGNDSYQIFFKKNYYIKPKDKALQFFLIRIDLEKEKYEDCHLCISDRRYCVKCKRIGNLLPDHYEEEE